MTPGQAMAVQEQEQGAQGTGTEPTGTLVLLLPAQVLAAVSAGAGGHSLPYLLTRPHSLILTSYVQNPLHLAFVHVLLKYISPAE